MHQRVKASFINQFHRFQQRWREGHWVQKMVALVILLVLLFVAFLISLVLMGIALLFIPYAWYKARQLRKMAEQARYQAAAQSPQSNTAPTGRIIEAEYTVVRK